MIFPQILLAQRTDQILFSLEIQYHLRECFNIWYDNFHLKLFNATTEPERDRNPVPNKFDFALSSLTCRRVKQV